ncbi:MAG: hypothetical protein JWQ71_3112 [Pedosphaera sp.]|nr:hypothetical protein [Pedosphaera sp.]
MNLRCGLTPPAFPLPPPTSDANSHQLALGQISSKLLRVTFQQLTTDNEPLTRPPTVQHCNPFNACNLPADCQRTPAQPLRRSPNTGLGHVYNTCYYRSTFFMRIRFPFPSGQIGVDPRLQWIGSMGFLKNHAAAQNHISDTGDKVRPTLSKSDARCLCQCARI